MEDGIEVGQENQGNLRFLTDPFDQGKDVVNARPGFQGPQVRFLDDDLRRWGRKGITDFMDGSAPAFSISMIYSYVLSSDGSPAVKNPINALPFLKALPILLM